MITVPVPQNMYQQVVAGIQSGESIQMVQGLQIASTSSGSTAQQGTIVAKVEEAAAPAPASSAKGLTITPVSSAVQAEPSSSQVGINSFIGQQRLINFHFQTVSSTMVTRRVTATKSSTSKADSSKRN